MGYAIPTGIRAFRDFQPQTSRAGFGNYCPLSFNPPPAPSIQSTFTTSTPFMTFIVRRFSETLSTPSYCDPGGNEVRWRSKHSRPNFGSTSDTGWRWLQEATSAAAAKQTNALTSRMLRRSNRNRSINLITGSNLPDIRNLSGIVLGHSCRKRSEYCFSPLNNIFVRKPAYCFRLEVPLSSRRMQSKQLFRSYFTASVKITMT